jgi:hypothetical protein
MSDLTTTIEFRQDVRGGTEPAGTTISLRVDEDGFHDTGGIGASGQIVAPLDIKSVVDLLSSEYEPDRVRAILRHFIELDRALDRASVT